MMIFPLIGLAALGIAIVRSACTHKQEGWVTGMVLGGFFAVIGVGGVVGILFF